MSTPVTFFSLPKEIRTMILCHTTLIPELWCHNDGSLSIQNGRIIRDANLCCDGCLLVPGEFGLVCFCRSTDPSPLSCKCTAFPCELLLVSRAFTHEVYEVFLQHNKICFAESLHDTFAYLSKLSPYHPNLIRDLVIEVPTHSWTPADTEIWAKLVTLLGSSLHMAEVRLTLDTAGPASQLPSLEKDRPAWTAITDTIAADGRFASLRTFYCLTQNLPIGDWKEFEAELGRKVVGERWKGMEHKKLLTRKRDPDRQDNIVCCLIDGGLGDCEELDFEDLEYRHFDPAQDEEACMGQDGSVRPSLYSKSAL